MFALSRVLLNQTISISNLENVKYYSKYVTKKCWNYLNQEIEEEVPNLPTRRSLRNSNNSQSNSPEFTPSAFFQEELTLNNTQTRTLQLQELPQEESPQEDHQARRLKETIKKPRWKWIVDKHKVAVYLTPLLAQWLIVSYMIQARGREHSHHHHRRSRHQCHSSRRERGTLSASLLGWSST